MKRRTVWLDPRRIWTTLAVSSYLLIAANLGYAQSLVALRGATVETVSAAGRIENATILIEDGKITAIGTDIPIPDRADIVDMRGKTIIPGIVDPYFVVDFPLGGAAPAESRTVQFGGRSFNLPDTTSAPAVFVRIADVFDARRGQWSPAVRSGITTANIVTSGYGQSVIGTPVPDTIATSLSPTLNSTDKTESPIVRDANGMLFAAVTNQPASLRLVRDGLSEPRAPGEGGAGSSRGGGFGGERGGRFGGGRRGGGGGGGGPGDGTPPTGGGAAAGTSSTSTPPSPPGNPADELWKAVREGERSVVLNANNAAAMLYLAQEAGKSAKAKMAIVASGSEIVQVISQLQQKPLTVVLPPRIDNQAGTQQRINAAQSLEKAKIPFAFSLSLGQSDYRATQNNPLFPVAMLIKAGLSREMALRALTLEPSRILGLDQELGTIEPGRRADLVVFDSDPFLATAEIVEVWSAGKPLSGN